MRKIKMVVVLSMMCVLFHGCPFQDVALGTVTPTSYRPTSDAGDGIDTTFTFSFEIISTSDIRVWERTDSTGSQTLKTETTHYSVTATNMDFTTGGTVTMVTAPASGITLVIGRVIPYDQQDNFIDGGVISLASITDALDKTILKVQQLEEMLNRASLNPETDDSTLDMTLPNSVDRASQFYGWNSSGEPTVISSGITAGSPTVTAYAETYLDDASEAAFKQTTNIESGVDVQAFDAGLLSIAGLTTAADKMIYTTASDTYAVTALTAAGRALIDDATAAAQLTTLGAAAADGSVAYTGTGVGFTDDDSMATVTATAPASGESVKAYVDAQSSGNIIQIVNFFTGNTAVTTTALPWDSTIPQNTEGEEFMTLAITPTSATSNLKIDVVFNFSHTSTTDCTLALFQDSTADALAAVAVLQETVNRANQMSLTHHMTAGTTSATTFKVRAGGGTGSTLKMNGNNVESKLGGVSSSTITITEYTP